MHKIFYFSSHARSTLIAAGVLRSCPQINYAFLCHMHRLFPQPQAIEATQLKLWTTESESRVISIVGCKYQFYIYIFMLVCMFAYDGEI